MLSKVLVVLKPRTFSCIEIRHIISFQHYTVFCIYSGGLTWVSWVALPSTGIFLHGTEQQRLPEQQVPQPPANHAAKRQKEFLISNTPGHCMKHQAANSPQSFQHM